MTRKRLLSLAAGVTAFIALVILLFPLYAVVVASFENNSQLLGTHYNFLPPTPSFANYRAVISAQGGHIVSTLIVGVGTAILTLAISLPAAHALARYRFRVTAIIVGGLLIAQILPSIVIANSLFILYHKLHLLDTYLGLILADASYAIPFSILVLRAFMLGLPEDVLQAARVDGASEWTTFTRVVLPMSRSADELLGRHHGGVMRVPERLGGFHLRPHPAVGKHVRADHFEHLFLYRGVLHEPRRGDGTVRFRAAARRHAAHRRATLHRG